MWGGSNELADHGWSLIRYGVQGTRLPGDEQGFDGISRDWLPVQWTAFSLAEKLGLITGVPNWPSLRSLASEIWPAAIRAGRPGLRLPKCDGAANDQSTAPPRHQHRQAVVIIVRW